MNDLIQALKDNEKAFGLMSEEMQAKAREIGKGEFEKWGYGGDWHGYAADGTAVRTPFDRNQTYRLRPDYQEEAEVEKCEVKLKDTVLQFTKKDKSHHWFGIHAAVNFPDFIGYLYEKDEDGDNVVSAIPRFYKFHGTLLERVSLCHIESRTAKVVTPIAVLFRRQPHE